MGRGNLSPRTTEATVAPTQRSGRGSRDEPWSRELGITRDVKHKPCKSCNNPARAGRAAGKAGSIPAKGLTASSQDDSRQNFQPSSSVPLKGSVMPEMFGRGGATLRPAARGILGREQGPPERCDSNCRRSNIASQTFSILCLPGALFKALCVILSAISRRAWEV